MSRSRSRDFDDVTLVLVSRSRINSGKGKGSHVKGPREAPSKLDGQLHLGGLSMRNKVLIDDDDEQ